MKYRLTLFFVFVVFCVYFYPRVLKIYLGEEHFLFSYLYVYFFGSLYFIFNIWLLLSSKAIDLKKSGEKTWFLFFTGSVLWGMLLHGLWILVAFPLPFKG